MNKETEELILRQLKKKWHELTAREKAVVESIRNRDQISRNLNKVLAEQSTLGGRVADAVARFGGSWTFLTIFGGFLVVWVAINTILLFGRPFDPYPYILLNLFLSMTAAVQAPVIMMSQNRQAVRDRLDAAHDYEVNLKAELEIRQLQEKFDELREMKWAELVEMQQTQLRFLEELLEAKTR